eukprot:63168-Prymnesium_polylepis.1
MHDAPPRLLPTSELDSAIESETKVACAMPADADLRRGVAGQVPLVFDSFGTDPTSPKSERKRVALDQ